MGNIKNYDIRKVYEMSDAEFREMREQAAELRRQQEENLKLLGEEIKKAKRALADLKSDEEFLRKFAEAKKKMDDYTSENQEQSHLGNAGQSVVNGQYAGHPQGWPGSH